MSRLSPFRPRPRHHAAVHFRPFLLRLEDRTVLANLFVTTLADAGPGSLRDRLAAAADGDVVRFAPALAGVITLTDGELVVRHDVTVRGPGAGRLAVSGGGHSRVFRIDIDATAVIEGLTVTGGSVAPPGGGGRGAGIENLGTLALRDVAVTGNATDPLPGALGGGVYNAGTLTMTGTTVSHNAAARNLGGGGGVYNAGTFVAWDSTIADNSVAGGAAFGGGGFGGGLYNTGTAAFFRVTVSADQALFGGAVYNAGTFAAWDSTFTGNFGGLADRTPVGSGGGGAVYSAAGRVVLFNSTFLDNGALVQGGAVATAGGALTVRGCTFVSNTVAGAIQGNAAGGAVYAGGAAGFTNSTFVGNTAQGGALGGSAVGGAIAAAGPVTLTNVTITANAVAQGIGTSSMGGGLGVTGGGTARLLNTIVAGNTGPAGASDIGGAADPASRSNLIGTGGSGGLVDGVGDNRVGVADPKLGPLADNGGPTPTVALLPGSPATAAGDPAGAPAVDQRGVVRGRPPSIGAYDPGRRHATRGCHRVAEHLCREKVLRHLDCLRQFTA